MIPDESYIDRKYRKHLFDTCAYQPEPVRLGLRTTYKLECPLCGAKGAHLVWMSHRRTWKFLCSTKSRANCQSQMEFPILLKSWCPELFRSYQQERLDAGTAGAGFNCPRPISTSVRRAPLKSCGSAKCQDQTQVSGMSTST